MTYQEDLEKGTLAENIIEEIINSDDGFYGIKYVSRDEEGNVIWQNVETRYGKVRHPDFKVYDTSTDEFVLLVEVKSLTEEYKNRFGLVKRLPRNESDLYVVAEKVKIDDYVSVQSHYETECKIVFVVGSEDEEKRFYWQTLDDLRESVVAEDKPYGSSSPLCYIWIISDLNNNLSGLL
jgi:hypothetical protein